MPATRAASDGVALGAGVAASVLWGLGNVVSKWIDVPGTVLALHRLWIGALVLGAVLVLRGGRPSRRDLRLAAPGGLAFGCNIAAFFTAIKATSVANASLIVALQPVVLMLLAGRLFGERVGSRQVALTGVAVIGVALVVAGGAGRPTWSLRGDLLAVVALGMWVVYFVASKRARQRLGSLEYQFSLTAIAAVVVLPLALVEGGVLDVGVAGLLGALALALVPGSGHLIMNWAHPKLAITTSSLLTLVVPVVAAGLAWVVLGESLVALQVLGGAVVLAGVAAAVHSRATSPG